MDHTESGKRLSAYRNRVLAFMRAAENRIRFVVLVLLVLVIVCQVVMLGFPELKPYMNNVNSLEGVPASD